MKTIKLLFTLTALCMYGIISGQYQKGDDINGEAAGDYAGYSVSMPDGKTLAIGAYGNDGSSANAGHVRIYTWNGTEWMQKGIDIDGEAIDDNSGFSVSMPDSNTVAIGAPYNYNSGHVRIYAWNGNTWVQKGTDINGETGGDKSGYSVSMPDKNTVAIGAIDNDGSGTNAGHVRIYAWNGSAWIQKGNDIDGETGGDNSGFSISMPDPNSVAIGAPNNSGNGYGVGHTRVYEWTGSAWIQKGDDIDGEQYDDFSGSSVHMPNANTVAIGTPDNYGSGNGAGHVRVYTWNGNSWGQKGSDIDGESSGDRFGYSVSMPNANIIAIGGYLNDDGGNNAGHVRLYQWSGSSWTQQSTDIDGEAPDDRSGISISMPNANTVAIGADLNDDSGNDAGHVRIFSFGLSSGMHDIEETYINIYPNPTNEKITIEYDTMKDLPYILKDVVGKVVKRGVLTSSNTLIDLSSQPKGAYILEISSGRQVICSQKIIKE